MLINVTVLNENFYYKNFSVEVDSLCTVNNVKEKIRALEGSQLEYQEIFMRKFEEDHRSKLMRLSSVENLSLHEIDNTSNLLLFTQPVVRAVVLQLNTLTDKVYKVPVLSSNTISEVKLKFQELRGVPPDQQRLIYAGKELVDERTVRSYLIPEDAVIHLLMKLRGGADGLIWINVCDFEQIFVRNFKNASIKYVKEEIAINEDIPVDKQMIYFDKQLLDDCCLLSDIKFCGTPKLDLIVPGRIKITVKFADSSYTLFVQVYDTTEKVREKLRKLGAGIKDHQKMCKDAPILPETTEYFVPLTCLEDGETLLSYNVKSGSVFRVVDCGASVI